MSAGAVWVGARLMDMGDYTTPFIIMATFYLVATLIYWRRLPSARTIGREGVRRAAGTGDRRGVRWLTRLTTTATPRRRSRAAHGRAWRGLALAAALTLALVAALAYGLANREPATAQKRRDPPWASPRRPSR